MEGVTFAENSIADLTLVPLVIERLSVLEYDDVYESIVGALLFDLRLIEMNIGNILPERIQEESDTYVPLSSY